MAFGFAGAAAGANDELQQMLTQRRAAFLQQQQQALQQRASGRADQELALQQQGAQNAEAERQRQAKLQTAQIAVSQARPGDELSPEVASQIQGTPYAARLETKSTLPSSTIPGVPNGATQSDAGGRKYVDLKPTAEQEQAQGQKAARGRLVELFQRGAPKNELLSALADSGENIPATELLKDPDRDLQDRLTEIGAQGKNAMAVARIGADSRDQGVVKVEHKDPATGRTVIEYLPKSEVRGKTFEKGTNATTANRLASAEAVNQTGQDIISKVSDPAYAQQLGVAMGRYNNLRQFVGDPPPEFAELAGLIESYSLANMGVHGMRSAQGAEMIRKLLDQPHTPQSLVGTINGLNQFSNHFTENEGMPKKPGTGGPPAAGGGPKVGDTKTFPNGRTGTFDGQGWAPNGR